MQLKNTIKIWLFAATLLTACGGTSYNEQATDETAKAVSVTVLETSNSWDGTLLPHYPEGTPKVTLLKITIPPKAKLAVHQHPIINVGYMLKGELKVTGEDGEVLLLKTGEGIAEMVNKYHYGENPGDEPAEILVFYAGDTESILSVYKE